MKKESQDLNSIQSHLFSLIVPSEILISFEITSVTEKEEHIFIYLDEKESCKPQNEYDLVLNGFFNPLELNSFPITGKQCFLILKRRKWKKRGTKGDISHENGFSNQYDYAIEGTKATKDFGAFLKEIGL